MFWQAREKHQEGRPYEEWDDSWKHIGASGLPGELTWDEFVAARSGKRLENIANTRSQELITFSGGSLFLPRAYAELIDRWEQVEEDLVAPGAALWVTTWVIVGDLADQHLGTLYPAIQRYALYLLAAAAVLAAALIARHRRRRRRTTTERH